MRNLLILILFIQNLSIYGETHFISINFKLNSTDTISCKFGENSTFSQIQELAKILVEKQNITLMICGHADINEKRKKRLAIKRAKFIKGILITQFNIDPKRLKTENYSDKRILISDTDALCLQKKEACRCLNRRVSTYIIK